MNERELVENAQLPWEKERRFLDSHHLPLTTHHLRLHVLRNARGFTFIEIMVVVAILAILAALVIPRIMGRTDDAKRTAAKVQIRNIEGALQLYKLDNGVYPSTEQGLKALVEKPTVGVIPRNWKIGGYLNKIPADPWGTPYKYLHPSSSPTKGAFEIFSMGADAETGGEGKKADTGTWTKTEGGAERGFTLTELLVVLVVIGTLLGFVLPKTGLTASRSSTSRQLIGAMRDASLAASVTQRIHRLNLDLS